MVVSLPFTHEEKEIEEKLCEVLGEIFLAVLKSMEGFKAHEEKLTVFMDKMEKLECELKDPDPELMKKRTVELLDKSFKMFEKEGSALKL